MTDIKHPAIAIFWLVLLASTIDWLADVFFKVLGGVL